MISLEQQAEGRNGGGSLDSERAVFFELVGMLRQRFEIAPQLVHSDAHFVGDLGVDREDLSYLALALEETFDINIPLADATGIARVRDAIDCVLRLRAKHV